MRVGEGGLVALIAAIEGQLELVPLALVKIAMGCGPCLPARCKMDRCAPFFVAADLVPVPFCVYSQRKSLGKPQ